MSFWKGIKDGFVGGAKSTWNGIKGAGEYAHEFATDSDVREAAWDSTVQTASAVKDYAVASYDDPAKPFQDLRNGAADMYTATSDFVQNAEGEDWGNLVGGGAFTVATLPVGGVIAKGVARGGAALKGVSKVAKVKKATKAANKFDNEKPSCITGCKNTSNKKNGGAERSEKYRKSWPKGDLETSKEKFLGKNPNIVETDSGKRIHRNPKSSIQIVEDIEGKYYRIEDRSVPGKRRYLNLEGNLPNNKILENGKQTGRTQSEYNAITHFKIGN